MPGVASKLFRDARRPEEDEDVFGPDIRMPTHPSRSPAPPPSHGSSSWGSARPPADRAQDVLPRPYGNYEHAAYLRAPSTSASLHGSPGRGLDRACVDERYASREDSLLRYGVFNRKAVPPDNRVHPERIVQGKRQRKGGLNGLICAGDEYRTTVMVKDVPVSYLGKPCV